ncbi:MAG TPA: hypothetical protein VIA06_16035 [Candidatus Dormibacteraeota bacterium]|jgi:hypothetical protein|nr:hypothetical protein [Candidatus Dormibacteraeota bacterium]
MGRGLQQPTSVVRDGRGYLELGRQLLPPIEVEGGETIGWRSADYPARAWALWEVSREERWRELAAVWEPVVRHLAEALCLLEDTADEGDAYLRLRAKDEISGPWLTVLRAITGEEDPGEVPNYPVGVSCRIFRDQVRI